MQRLKAKGENTKGTQPALGAGLPPVTRPKVSLHLQSPECCLVFHNFLYRL